MSGCSMLSARRFFLRRIKLGTSRRPKCESGRCKNYYLLNIKGATSRRRWWGRKYDLIYSKAARAEHVRTAEARQAACNLVCPYAGSELPLQAWWPISEWIHLALGWVSVLAVTLAGYFSLSWCPAVAVQPANFLWQYLRSLFHYFHIFQEFESYLALE